MKKLRKIDKLIINSPYEEPKHYWQYLQDEQKFQLCEGRRPAGYIVASESSKSLDTPGVFHEIPFVNLIRPRIKTWRDEGYTGVTGITKRLLTHWQDNKEREINKFFFCQLEAIETLIFLTEAPDSLKTGLKIEGDGGDFVRWCSKMATGSGKTIIMSMLIAWHVLNKVANAKDTRFSKNVLVVAPGLTVKSRLQVLNPANENNYYQEFNIVPSGLMDSLRQGKIKIINWHFLAWDSEEKIQKRKGVDKRGAKSDESYVREVLGEMTKAKNIIVINDEAHHAWRVNPDFKAKREDNDLVAEATIWINGLDRIHRAKGILKCFDLSATPFAPSGKKATEEALFPWIVSDFGLNDAIESGLVKTPRVVIRDDGNPDNELRTKLYHIYPHVKDDINRKGALENEPLPDLITQAYTLLAKDWHDWKKEREEEGRKTPPVMITIANTTITSSRIFHSFLRDSFLLSKYGFGDLNNAEGLLQIDSSVLAKIEAESNESDLTEPIESEKTETTEPIEQEEKKESKKTQAENLRKTVDTVGKEGQRGEKIQNVISVGMLSEGWDAKTVTHILGLRAFSSQLLCEQVVGRGLRRTSYEVGEDGLFEAEYVNIFGVPFTFLPHEDGDTPKAKEIQKPKTKIEPLKSKAEYEITIPNVIRIDYVYKSKLTLDINTVKSLELDPYDSITKAELAAILDGKPNLTSLTEIDIRKIAEKTRLQTIIFLIAKDIYNSEQNKNWKGSKETLLIQLIGIIERFINSNRIVIKNPVFNKDEIRRRILIMLNMNKVIQHIWNEIKAENAQELTPVFDKERPYISTAQMTTWWTSKVKPNQEPIFKTQVNYIVSDSKQEHSTAKIIDECENVIAFAKNDHLGFAIYYNYQGVIHKYYPDFIIKLKSGKMLILEVKGYDDLQNKTKREFLNDWCKAINNQKQFGEWVWEVSFNPNDLLEKLLKY